MDLLTDQSKKIQKVFSCSGQNLTEVRSMFGHVVFYFIGQMHLQCRTHKESQDLCVFIGRNPISILLFLASLVDFHMMRIGVSIYLFLLVLPLPPPTPCLSVMQLPLQTLFFVGCFRGFRLAYRSTCSIPFSGGSIPLASNLFAKKDDQGLISIGRLPIDDWMYIFVMVESHLLNLHVGLVKSISLFTMFNHH